MPFFTQKVCGRARTRLPTEVDRKSPFPIAVLQLCLATQVICARADILDVREQITRETQLYRSAHPEFQAAPKHDFRPTRVQAATSPDMQLPGGVGFGYYFDDAAFRWTNSTIMDYYIIAPSTMGGNLNYYLYLTSTCRAQLGTEALVSYYSQNQAGFWVFDWSLPSNQWQVGITLPGSHIQYQPKADVSRSKRHIFDRLCSWSVYMGKQGVALQFSQRGLGSPLFPQLYDDKPQQ
jgi:hypothetical protein